MRELLLTLPNSTLWVFALFSFMGYVTLSVIGWYLLSSATYALNGGQMGRSRWLFPFECFFEDLPCYLPGGRKHRVAFIENIARNQESITGHTRSWSHHEIQYLKNYEEIFFDVREGRFVFWVSHLFKFLFGSLVVLAVVCLLIVSAIQFGITAVTNRLAKTRASTPQ
jgi:hypothetical protein